MSFVLYLRRTLELTIVMVTHDLDTLSRTCDRVAVLVDGKVIVDTLPRSRITSTRGYVNISTDRARPTRGRNREKRWKREARYAVVGLFAIATIVLAFGFVWWYSDASDRREYARYEIHFFGSVSGLAQGSPVRYLGVDVGRVERLQVDPNNPRRVKIVVEIDSSAPISGATEARLGLLGLTGLLFIDLREDPKRVASTPLVQGDRYPVIRARKGDIEAFLERLPDAITRAAKVMERVEKLLNQENIDAVGKSLANIREATGELPALIAQRLDARGRAQTNCH